MTHSKELQPAEPKPPADPSAPEPLTEQARLAALGFKPVHHQHWLELAPERRPFRIHAVDRGMCRLVTARREGDPAATAIESFDSFGADYSLADAMPPKVDPVAVGDWVVLDDESAERPRIAVVLPRTTTLERGAVLDRSERQLIATNLDTVFVVCAFATTAKLQSRALNPRRIERYVALVTSSGATPVVLLNKADLVDDWEDVARQLSSRLGNTLVCPVSAAQGSGIPELDGYLAPGQTVAFVGLSGVGKSTLINRLLGVDAQHTGEVRDVDSKGKHTTTRRQMLAMTCGALLVDTPGMRELGVTETMDDAAFEEIAELASRCRFGDCKHDAEPGCAVRAALSSGSLDAERLQSYRSLAQQSQRFAARYDAYARHQQNVKFRKLGKLYKSAQKKR